MATPLMPKATAVWLVENTALTFHQISQFCDLHILEIQAIADGETSTNIIGLSPIMNGQLTKEEINRCEQDTTQSLCLIPPLTTSSLLKKKTSRYTPVSKRQDRPDAIAWLIKFYPTLSETQICHLLGTTKNMINAVRQKTHWNSSHIKPRHPVQLGLCSQGELDRLIETLDKRISPLK